MDNRGRGDIDPEQMLSQQVSEARRRRDSREQESQETRTTPVQRIKKNTSALQRAIRQSKDRENIPLHGVQAKYGGELLSVLFRRLTIQELAASSMLPRRADKLVSVMLERGMEASEQARQKYGVTNPKAFSNEEVEEIIENDLGGMNRDTAAAFFEFQAMVACVACIDEETRIYLTQEEVEQDPDRGVLVWDIPPQDIESIFDWVFRQEEVAEDQVLPFHGGRDANESVPSGQRLGRSAERIGDV